MLIDEKILIFLIHSAEKKEIPEFGINQEEKQSQSVSYSFFFFFFGGLANRVQLHEIYN